jgi:hypothetical protein
MGITPELTWAPAAHLLEMTTAESNRRLESALALEVTALNSQGPQLYYTLDRRAAGARF